MEAQRIADEREVSDARARLLALEEARARKSLAPPMVTLITGFAGAFVTTVLLGDVVDAKATIALGATGVAVGSVGAFWLHKTLRSRRVHDPELLPLRRRVPVLERYLALQASSSSCAAASEQKRTALARLDTLEARLTERRSLLSHHPIAGPLALTLSGAIIATPLLSAGALIRITTEYPDEEGINRVRNANIVLASGAAALTAGLAGAVWLIKRKNARRELVRDIRELEKQALEISATPVLSSGFAGAGLTISF